MRAAEFLVTVGGTLVIVWCLRWYWREDFGSIRSIWQDWRRRRRDR